MDIELLQPGDEKEWDEFVTSSDNATFYHLAGWREVITRTFGHQPYYFIAQKDNIIRGVLPLFLCSLPFREKMLVSVPYANFGGISGDSESEAVLLEKAMDFALEQDIGYVMLKHKYGKIPDLITHEAYVTVEMELDSDESVTWEKIGSKVRNQVRKATNSGLSVDFGIEYLPEFYKVYARNTRDLGSPVYGLEYFKNIFSGFPDQSEILVVKYEGTVIGGILLLWFGNIMCGPAASSLRKYFELCPNNLLYWETLRFAIGKKMKIFDFGRSTIDTGPYRFKKQWRGKTKQVYYQYWFDQPRSAPVMDPDSPRYKLASALWRQLPLTVTDYLGPKVMRYLL